MGIAKHRLGHQFTITLRVQISEKKDIEVLFEGTGRLFKGEALSHFEAAMCKSNLSTGFQILKEQ
jgi:hypothetical protein